MNKNQERKRGKYYQQTRTREKRGKTREERRKLISNKQIPGMKEEKMFSNKHETGN